MGEPNASLPKKRLSMSKEVKGFFSWLVFRNQLNLYVLAFGFMERSEDFTAFDKRQVAVDLLLQDEQMFAVPLEMVRNAEMYDSRLPVDVRNVYN